MAKILALDLGNVWTGVAISDPLQHLARPLRTVKTKDLIEQLTLIFAQDKIETVVVGLPITSKAGLSQQTAQIIAQKEALEKQFPQCAWTLFNERFTSQQAAMLQRELGKKSSGKKEKEESHSLAAAFLLDAFLATHQQARSDDDEDDANGSTV